MKTNKSEKERLNDLKRAEIAKAEHNSKILYAIGPKKSVEQIVDHGFSICDSVDEIIAKLTQLKNNYPNEDLVVIDTEEYGNQIINVYYDRLETQEEWEVRYESYVQKNRMIQELQKEIDESKKKLKDDEERLRRLQNKY